MLLDLLDTEHRKVLRPNALQRAPLFVEVKLVCLLCTFDLTRICIFQI